MAESPPATPSPSAAARVTAAAAKTFKHIVSVKLDDSNYLQWKQQVEGVLRGTKMVKHVISPQIPPVYLTDADRETGSENPAYTAWEEQDSLLCTWILSTISATLLSRFVSLRQSWQVWEEVHNYCYTQMRTRSRQLRSELRSITKGSRSISEFIARIRTISESLMSIGDPVPHRDLIEVVLEALPEEFNPVVVSVNSQSEIITLDELESQLLTLEARHEKFKKSLAVEQASVNLTQNPSKSDDKASPYQAQFGANPGQNSNFPQNSYGNNQSQYPSYNNDGRSDNSRGRGYRGGRNRGRGGRNYGRGSIQCQICYKVGHDASYCYYRFDNAPYGNGGFAMPPNVWMQNAVRPPQYNLPRPSFPPQYGNPRPQAPQAFLTGNESIASSSFNNGWYPDSGATHHVTPDAANLMDAASASGSDHVQIGNGQGLAISSIGSMSFSSPYCPHTTLKLNNLLHVPSITKNLVSVSQFARDNHVYFEFHPYDCFVKCQDSSKLLLKGRLGSDGLYQFDTPLQLKTEAPVSSSFKSTSQPTSQAHHALVLGPKYSSSTSTFKIQCNNVETSNSSNSSVSSQYFPSLYKIWHDRLGHPHHEVLKYILKLCNKNIPNKSLLDFCSACCLGKVHRLPSYSSTATYTKPLELVFCDLWGPAPLNHHVVTLTFLLV
jgi:histone deacetylase 1/2